MGAPRRRSPGRAGPDRLHRYTDGRRAHKKLSLYGLHHRRIKHPEEFANGKNHINGVESFRGDTQRRRKAAHAGFKRNFRRCIREGSFRFKHRDDENTPDYPQDALLIWSAQVT